MAEHAPLIAGFDAGQTHTTCRLARLDRQGNLRELADGEGSGVCHLEAPAGSERFAAALHSALQAALAAAGLPSDQPLTAAAVGASGIEQGSGVATSGVHLAAATLRLPDATIVVTGDERTALRGAFPDAAGILVICGTGCIAVGRGDDGREQRCGGWGWLLDGAGSAMDMGRDALMLSVRMADGRAAETPLRQRLWDNLGIRCPQELKGRVVQAEFGPAAFARLAPLVDQLAGEGDGGAIRIVQDTARELVGLVAGVAGPLALAAPQVAAVGGAIRHLPTLRAGFETALRERLPQACLVNPDHDACHGALLMARDRLRGGLQPLAS